MSKKTQTRARSRKSTSAPTKAAREALSRVANLRQSVTEFINDESFDHRLDQGVDFLAANGFGGTQLKHLFSLSNRRQKFMYIASVAGCTVAVTLFSRGLVGRTLKRVPFLRWG